MSHSVNVSPEARAKDAAFLQERAASGKEKYIVRHSKQARLTHGITGRVGVFRRCFAAHVRLDRFNETKAVINYGS